ncbi:hypothetical protein ACJMQP_19695 [Rhodopseudomonas palustris]
MIKSYLTADTADEILDLEIYENHLATAASRRRLRRSLGADPSSRASSSSSGRSLRLYEIDALADTEGPYANFCPKRILDILTPTDDRMAQEWRERCRERLSKKAGAAPSPSMD